MKVPVMNLPVCLYISSIQREYEIVCFFIPFSLAQIGVIGENEEWVMVHQLTNEPDARSLIVEGLNPYTFYRYTHFYLNHLHTPASPAYWVLIELYFRFRMRQVNIVGTSPPSQPSRKIQTLQAPPDIAPANVTLRTASETSLWLRWVVGEHLKN